MEQDQEPTVEQRLAKLVGEVKGLIQDARGLATHTKQISAPTAEAFRRGESSEIPPADLERQRSGRGALQAGVSRSLHEIGLLLDDWEEHEGIDWPKIISLKRERDALVLRERPTSQIESEWVEDRLLAIEALLARISEVRTSNAVKSTPPTVGSDHPGASQTIGKPLGIRYSRNASETIGEFIDRCREELGFRSLEALALEAGLDPAQIYRLKNGAGVHTTTLSKAAQALKCLADDLLPPQ